VRVKVKGEMERKAESGKSGKRKQTMRGIVAKGRKNHNLNRKINELRKEMAGANSVK